MGVHLLHFANAGGKALKSKETLSSFWGARIEDVLKRCLWNLE